MADHDKEDDLTRRLASPGWRLTRNRKDDKPLTGTLEELVKTTHERKARGEATGLIQEIETMIELDMIQIEKLWRYLGLPV